MGADPDALHRGDPGQVPIPGRRPAVRLGTRRHARHQRLLLLTHGRTGQPVHAGRGPTRIHRTRPQPAAPEPHPGRLPPADALSRLRRVLGAVRLRDRGAGHRAGRRGLAGRDPALDRDRLGVPHRRHHPRCLVELRGPRLGWVLGVGPRRERLAAALAHRNRLPAFGDGAGTSGHAAGLEPVAVVRHLLPHHPGDLPHPFGGRQLGPCLLRGGGRAMAAGLLHRRGPRLGRSDRVAGRSSPLTRRHRLRPVAGGLLPGQQRGLRSAGVRRVAGDRVPAAGRGVRRQPTVDRSSLFRLARSPDRLRDAVPHGVGPRPALAQGLDRVAGRAPVLALGGRRRGDGPRRRARRPGPLSR